MGPEQISFVFLILKTQTDDTLKVTINPVTMQTLYSSEIYRCLIDALELTAVLDVIFAYQRWFGTVDFLPDQNTKVRPRQQATEDIADFIM